MEWVWLLRFSHMCVHSCLINFFNIYISVFRLGKSIDNFRAALQTIHLHNPLLRFLVTLTKLNRGLYLMIDHLIWAYRMKLLRINIDSWSKHANRFWLLAIFLGLIRDTYEFLRAVHVERKRLQQYSSGPDSKETPVSMRSVLHNVVCNNPAVVLDLLKNSADIFIPISRLDILYIPSGIVGLLGVVSSLAGISADFNEQLKLKFS